MRFAETHSFYLFWLVCALILFYIWVFRKKKKAMERFASKNLFTELTKSLDFGKQSLKAFLLIGAISFIALSLSRPQWGFHWERVRRTGLDILIAIDTSKSMLAEDVKPNRLERSKLAVEDLLGKLKGDRIGLIAFAGKAFLQCPLTVDYSGFLLSLNDLSVNTIPMGGTSISSAIYEAIKSYKGGVKKYKVLILITDGEDHKGDPIKAAEKAKKEGIKIFCVGIGTPEGELIPITDKQGNRVFLKDRNGNVVKSRLNESILQKIALVTGGDYIRATGAEFGLDLIYEKKIEKMKKREIKSRMIKRYEERFQIPLALALILLLLESSINEKRRIK